MVFTVDWFAGSYRMLYHSVVSFFHLCTLIGFYYVSHFPFALTFHCFSHNIFLNESLYEMCCTNKVALSCWRNEHWDFLIASSVFLYILCVFCPFYYSFLLLLSWTQRIFNLYCLVYCPSFTIFLIIFNFSLLLFSCCSDTISLRGSIKFHLIWTWWNCVRLSKELLLLYLVQILNWVGCCDPAALILRLMDFYFPSSQMWLSLFWKFFICSCCTLTRAIFTEFSRFMLHAASCVEHCLSWSFFSSQMFHFNWNVQVKQWNRCVNWYKYAWVDLSFYPVVNHILYFTLLHVVASPHSLFEKETDLFYPKH